MKKIVREAIRKAILEKYPFGACTKCYSASNIKPFNYFKNNYLACEKCKTYWYVGTIFSSWRHESHELWRKNAKKYGKYEEISDCSIYQDIDAIAVDDPETELPSSVGILVSI